jgi:hypothetical protein
MARALKERAMRETCADCKGSGRVTGTLWANCARCDGSGVSRVRCSQCWKWRKAKFFLGKTGNLVKRCDICTKKYKNWESKSLEERERATSPRSGIDSTGALRVSIALKSGNRKTGPIPVTMTAASTCPPSCPLMNRGCYAEQHMVAIHWRRLSAGKTGLTWGAFLKVIESLPDGQVWRHNEAGDLPGVGEDLDAAALTALVDANRGKRGFTYTHKDWRKFGAAIRTATARGFTVNVSTDSLAEADLAARAGLPVTTVLPHDAPARGNRTPDGVRVVICPAETHEAVTCEKCKLCAVPGRSCIIGFRAHGDRKKQISERHRQLPLILG